jgi:hypothetical protein
MDSLYATCGEVLSLSSKLGSSTTVSHVLKQWQRGFYTAQEPHVRRAAQRLLRILTSKPDRKDLPWHLIRKRQNLAYSVAPVADEEPVPAPAAEPSEDDLKEEFDHDGPVVATRYKVSDLETPAHDVAQTKMSAATAHIMTQGGYDLSPYCIIRRRFDALVEQPIFHGHDANNNELFRLKDVKGDAPADQEFEEDATEAQSEPTFRDLIRSLGLNVDTPQNVVDTLQNMGDPLPRVKPEQSEQPAPLFIATHPSLPSGSEPSASSALDEPDEQKPQDAGPQVKLEQSEQPAPPLATAHASLPSGSKRLASALEEPEDQKPAQRIKREDA